MNLGFILIPTCLAQKLKKIYQLFWCMHGCGAQKSQQASITAECLCFQENTISTGMKLTSQRIKCFITTVAVRLKSSDFTSEDMLICTLQHWQWKKLG